MHTFAAIVFAVASLGAQTPAGTTFTYQGRLTEAGGPANGSYDLRFALYDAATGGSQVGSTVTQSGVTVSAGVFSVLLDFGGSAFTGSARWLEVAVRHGGTSEAYTTITPRAQLTSSPYAIYALDSQRFGGSLPSDYATKTELATELADYTLFSDTVHITDRLTDLETTAQTRVSGTCSVGSSIRAIAENGTVTCESTGSMPVVGSPPACTASNAGSVYYNSAIQGLEFCNGSSWRALGAQPAWARSSGTANGYSCWGGNSTTFSNTGLSLTYTSTGRPILVGLSVGSTSVGSTAGWLTFRITNQNGTELAKTTIAYASGEVTPLTMLFGSGPVADGSVTTLKLECAAQQSSGGLNASEFQFLVFEQ